MRDSFLPDWLTAPRLLLLAGALVFGILVWPDAAPTRDVAQAAAVKAALRIAGRAVRGRCVPVRYKEMNDVETSVAQDDAPAAATASWTILRSKAFIGDSLIGAPEAFASAAFASASSWSSARRLAR